MHTYIQYLHTHTHTHLPNAVQSTLRTSALNFMFGTRFVISWPVTPLKLLATRPLFPQPLLVCSLFRNKKKRLNAHLSISPFSRVKQTEKQQNKKKKNSEVFFFFFLFFKFKAQCLSMITYPPVCLCLYVCLSVSTLRYRARRLLGTSPRQC